MIQDNFMQQQQQFMQNSGQNNQPQFPMTPQFLIPGQQMNAQNIHS